MPTSSYMPDVVVEIGFTSGFRTPLASMTWTDVSDYVELADGLSITWGRQDERSTADANSLTLTLDNSDGDFTAGKSSGAYYPNVVLYRPIRVRATPVDGSESTRFLGYITSWPVEWDGTDATAKATVTASSRLARLGLNASWRSLLEETFLFDSPTAYYPLGDPEGSTMAADVSGNGAQPLAMVGLGADVVFGQATGPGTDGLTAATFAGGKWLRGPNVGAVTALTWSQFFLGSPAENFAGGVEGVFYLKFKAPDEVIVTNATGTHVLSASGTTSHDGGTHHYAVTISGTTWTLYMDGVSVDSAVVGAITTGDAIVVGQGYLASSFPVITGTAAHVAVYDTALSGTRIAAHAAAGSDAWAGELTSDRLERYAELAGIPTAEVDAETGTVTVAAVDTSGGQVVELMRLMETTEGGVLFDDRDGTLTMHNRSHRYGATADFTLDFAKHEVEADFSPRLDASALANDVTITSPVTSAHLVDETSRDDNGLATASAEIAAESADEPLRFASWALHVFKTPRVRVPSLSVDALAQVGKTVTCADVMAATLGTKVATVNQPAQAESSSGSYFIEGGTESYGPESLVLTWNVTSSWAEDSLLILDDATYGDLDVYAWPF